MRRVTIVGFAGDSGAGKSTYVKAVASLLGPERVTIIGLDDYHTLDRAQRKAVGITPLNPRCNDLGLLVDHAWQLRRGETIVKPVYDHSTGTFGAPETVTPGDYVILEGLHALYLEMLRAAEDLRVYFDTDPELKLRWKIERDVADRGHTLEQVKQEIAMRQPDIRAYIEPQKVHADLIIQLAPKEGTEKEIKVYLWERPSPHSIHSRLARGTWLERLGIVAGAGSVNGQTFETLELRETVPPETARALMAELGVAAPAAAASGLDPVALSHLLVAWRILTCRQAATEVLAVHAAQG